MEGLGMTAEMTDIAGTKCAAGSSGQAAGQKLGPSRVRFGLASVLRWSERLVDRVVSAYDRLFCLNEQDTAEIYMHIGTDLAKKGSPEEAVVALTHTLAIQPENGQAWVQLGLVQLKQEASAAAVEAFERAKQLGCDSFELHFHYAEALVDLERTEEAVTALYTALEKQPGSAEAAYRLGVALDQLERYEEAVAAFKIAIAHGPRVVSYYQSLGFTLESLGRRDEAINYFKRAVNLERRSA